MEASSPTPSPTPSKDDFERFILSQGQSDFVAKRAARFAEILYRENKVQNLTRIVGLEGFYFDHLVDCLELLKTGWLGSAVFDLGSGCGVPGLLSAVIDSDDNRKWVLCDSESSKAAFLAAAIQELGAKNRVLAASGRAEALINEASPSTVMARAVGKVEKIMSYIDNCSTWNNLILFKGPGWSDEWKDAQKTRFGKKLTVTQTHEYLSNGKRRTLINLKRK